MTSPATKIMDLQVASHHCRLLADSTRLRLLLLLEQEELSVAELAAITQLAQPRVSTHLAKLKEAGLVVLPNGHSHQRFLTGNLMEAFAPEHQ
jgi:predicted transcriptional regulator